MSEKVIIRSATIDLHGDYIPLKMLQDYVVAINGNTKMRYLANHRRDIPPIGYFDNAEIREKEGIHHVLVEPILYKNRTVIPWDNKLFMEETSIPVSFIGHEKKDNFRIAVDKNNFPSMAALHETGKKLVKLYEEEVSLQLNTRKNLIPDPQVIVTLANYAFILYPLLKPFLSKMGEKIAEDIADDLYNTCKSNFKVVKKKLSESVRLIRGEMIPKNKVLTTIFEIPGTPYIELQIKSDDPTKIEKGLSAANLFRVHKKIMNLQLQLEIVEIYFFLNTKDKWEFSYLITQDGKIVGTNNAFRKRDRLVQRIQLSPTKAFSLGADGVQYERRASISPPDGI
ncbi:hypothetical protein ATE47_01525 [Chryseobacterium sp. IHB B 17019]|uniref:hypothetical protein n=1 Tax=Chryseobacterium sp. IHB B 17019 TaxID=1721091 RepID=UPI0007204714|nr:hypothetical protein [Chryseobacterium sp. IHB B 17019]ALR29291.1 hypothetical protein ATE47_01525 [Chryseobacterium sp. IHB B 17019]